MATNPYVAAAAGIVAMALAFEHLYNEVSKINKIGGLAARVLGAIFGGPSGKLGSMLKIEDAVRDLFGVKKSPKRGDGFTSFNVPMMANGGIIRHSPGGTLALIGEGGRDEAVIPLDRAGGMGGINITVHAGLVSSPDQVGQQIIEAIQKAQRRSGPVFAPA
jgi:hypothetical protein